MEPTPRFTPLRSASGASPLRSASGAIAFHVSRFTFHVSHILSLILLVYLIIAAQYASRTPAWQTPDEPAHYNYIRYIVENGTLPVLQPGDYDQKFNEQFTNPKNTPNLPIDPMRYEFWQPPLYYLLAAPIYAMSGGSLVALRLMSVALGGVLIVVAFAVAREVKPDRPEIALGTAAFVAFVPQHVAMLAGVNNDSLAELLLALTLLQTLRILNRAPAEASTPKLSDLLLGLLLGLGFLTKGTNYLIVPVVFAALLLPLAERESLITHRSSRFTFHVSRFALIFLPALALGSLWWLRNIVVYGGFDILGLANHNAVVIGQPLTSDWIARMGFGPFLISAMTTTFHSFWGQFGWMGVPMPDPFYLALGVLCIVAFTGWLASRPTIQFSNYRAIALTLLVLFTFGYYIFYNFTFVQHQGRYLFPALIPIGLIFSIGIDRWTRLLPRPIGALIYIGVFAALAALDVWALYRFIIPSLDLAGRANLWFA